MLNCFASHAFHPCLMIRIVEYIVETLPKVYARKFKFITRVYIVGEFALYMLVLLTSLALVVVYVSTIGFDMG